MQDTLERLPITMDEEKVIQRIEHLMFYICGCTRSEAAHVLEKMTKRVKNMGRKTQSKMKKSGLMAIEDIPNAVEGWYKASKTLALKVRGYRKKLADLYKAHMKTKLQVSMDSLFKEYIRKNHKDIYWAAVRFIEQKNPKTAKEFGKAIGDLKVGPFYPKPKWAQKQIVRTDVFAKGLVEDICSHGIGHPNKDWLEKNDVSGAFAIHNCDLCCGKDDVPICDRLTNWINDGLTNRIKKSDE
jgi:hypothetical protein